MPTNERQQPRDLESMNSSKVAQLIKKQDWLEPAENVLETVADSVLEPAGQPARNFLHGTWLGHPLHPAITDVPVGAWTAAAALDAYEAITGDTKYSAGADACVGIGLIGAVGAALSGMADWRHTGRAARRIGAVHALLNIAATGLYLTSWLQRRSADEDEREGAITTGFLGFATVMVSAWLGGMLVYEQKIGVDHAQRGGPKEWTAVLPETELAEAQLRRVETDGVRILLAKRNGRIFAIGEKCSHLGGPLSEGKFEGDTVVCPWHGSRFALADGSVIDGPATCAEPLFETRVTNNQIEVRAVRKE